MVRAFIESIEYREVRFDSYQRGLECLRLASARTIGARASTMWKANLSPKYFRLVITLFVCLVGAQSRHVVAQSQDRVSQTPTITLDLVKDDLMKPNEPYRVNQQVRIRVIAKNESAEQITVPVISHYHQNRPELFRKGKLVAYTPEIAKVVRAKIEDEGDIVGLGRQDFINLLPYSSKTIEIINLSDWYGSLDPGSYQLTNRFRSKIGGPWSADSKPVVFEVSR